VSFDFGTGNLGVVGFLFENVQQIPISFGLEKR